jgi:hypothetical protein
MAGKRAHVAVAVLVLVTAMAVYAGTAYKVKCETPGCRSQWSVGIGGGGLFEKETGYCMSCDTFVSVSWSRRQRPPAALKIWDPKTGETISLYPCPRCQNLFMPIRSADDLRHCPKCKKPSLKSDPYLVYD